MTPAPHATGRTSPRQVSTPATDGGPVRLREPELVELVWMEDLRQHLRAPGLELRSAKQLSDLFDRYCLEWHQRWEEERWNPNSLIAALGVALGDILVAQSSSSRWAVVADAPVTTVAVRNDLFRRTIFPVDAVARRWISAQTAWVPAFVTATSNGLQRTALRELAARETAARA